jgi:hypothetical protein
MGGASYAVVLPAFLDVVPGRRNFADLSAIVYRSACKGRPLGTRAFCRHLSGTFRRLFMNEDALNISVRKFLKKVGVTSQREIEQAVRAAVGGGRLRGNETLPATVTLTVDGVGLAIEIKGTIGLE